MPAPPESDDLPGVYAQDAGGSWRRVHTYQTGGYGLEDVVSCFDLGRLEKTQGEELTVLVISARELDLLKAMADAYSFDYEEEFIEMCQALRRHAEDRPLDTYRFVADF